MSDILITECKGKEEVYTKHLKQNVSAVNPEILGTKIRNEG